MISIEQLNFSKSNSSEMFRKRAVSVIAKVASGAKTINDTTKLYERILTEAAGDTPSRVTEFIPIKLTYANMSLMGRIYIHGLGQYSWEEVQPLLKYSFVKDGSIYTNMRALLKFTGDYKKIPYNDVVEDFVVMKLTVPMFVWAQLYTHTQLSKISRSDRIGKSFVFDYWLPPGFFSKLESRKDTIVHKTLCSSDISEKNIKAILFDKFTQGEVIDLFKDLGYPKEVYSRALYYFRYKTFVIAGYKDATTWDNLFAERLSGWTQVYTKAIVNKMKTVYDTGISYNQEV